MFLYQTISTHLQKAAVFDDKGIISIGVNINNFYKIMYIWNKTVVLMQQTGNCHGKPVCKQISAQT